MAAASLLPLCPTCYHRVMAWNAAACPECKQSSHVAECDACQKSRAGAFLPEDSGAKDGGAQRFLCVDCMEADLETAENDALMNSVLAVVLSIAAVRYYGRFAWLPYATIAAFALALVSFVAWFLAARTRRHPSKRQAAAWKGFRRRIEKSLSKRPGAHAR